ncbi:single Ig IL-1-related receptor isoform 3-T3 [Clarias gariepinus]
MGYTGLFVCLMWIQCALMIGEPLCSKILQFVPSSTKTDVWESQGSSVELNCTVLIHFNNNSEIECKAQLHWNKNGEPLPSTGYFTQNTSQWSTGKDQLMLSSVLTVSLKDKSDFGLYSCEIWNSTTTFRLQKTNGKIYDAYISYINDENDHKFVNFILKPQLENKCGYKLLLNDTNILPGAEPSAELLMNISRCRRLIVVLSQGYLQQEWCTSNFRQGLFHLMELCRKPIFIVFQSQKKSINVDICQHLRDHQGRITTLIWGAHSIAPSSGFWKALALAMPRKVMFHSELIGDPQTLLQGDRDPMLTVQPDYLDCTPDPDPAGDLGIRFPIYKAMSRDQVLPTSSEPVTEAKTSEIDVSDLGSRSYAARTDFYCLVTDDI